MPAPWSLDELRSALDASERRAAGSELRRETLQTILDAVAEALWIQDAEGRFLEVNEGVLRMFGYPRSFFLGKAIQPIAAPGLNDLNGLAERFGRVLLGEPQQFEFWGLSLDGSIVPLEVRLYPALHQGQPVVIALAQDISRRKKAERHQQSTYRISEAAVESRTPTELFGKVHAIIRELMPADNFYFALWNKANGTVSFPYWVDQMDPQPTTRPLMRGLTEYVFRTGEPQWLDEEGQVKLFASGHLDHLGSPALDWLGLPLKGPTGVFGAMVLQSYQGGHVYSAEERETLLFVSRQVALAIERNRVEMERRVLNAAMDLALDPVFGSDAQGRLVFVNEAACSTLGYAREELLSRWVWEVDPWVQPDQWQNRWATVRREGNQQETQHQRKDGTAFPVEISSRFLAWEGQEVIFTTARDITSRKAAEASLQASEEKFSRAFQANPDGMAISSLDGLYLELNAAFSRITGWTREEALGKKAIDLAIWEHPEDRADLMELITSQGYLTERILPFRVKDGRLRTGSFSATLIPMDGKPCLLTIVRDITDQQAAEQALLQERGLFIGGPVMVFKWRAVEGWPVEYASPNVASILGYSIQSLMDHSVSFESLIHPEDLPRLQREIAGHLGQGRHHFDQEYRLRTSTGQYRWFYDFTAAADQNPQPTHFFGYLLDITDRRHQDELLRQTQKLESLGVLAGGIAHDFNNLLTVMLGNLDLAQLQLAETTPAHTYLKNMEAALLRATDLTKQMLAYSGRGHFVVKRLDLNALVKELAQMLEVSISKKARLHYHLADDLPGIQADAVQLQQVVMNLVINASEAIGDREGAIHLGTRSLDLGEASLRNDYRVAQPNAGLHVIMEVQDTGSGMGPDVLARIFEPFFTTKSTGRGLGLSALMGIVRGHGAGLQVRSSPGQGTTFCLCFPASESGEATEANPPALPTEALMQGLVLLVDDEPDLIRTMSLALKTLGFEVESAADGREALERFQELRGRLVLVLMDITMPRMDGCEAFLEMQQLDPGVPVILSSGFNRQDSLLSLNQLEPAGFLQKPYPIKELRRAIEVVLER